MIISFCVCCGYAFASDNKKATRCRWCKETHKGGCRHWLPERPIPEKNRGDEPGLKSQTAKSLIMRG